MNQGERVAQIQAMLAETPGDAELRYMLAMEYVSQGDDATAERTFADLIAVAPDYAPGYHMAGRTLVRLGRLGEAKALLERGIGAAQKQGNHHAAGEMSELLASLEE